MRSISDTIARLAQLKSRVPGRVDQVSDRLRDLDLAGSNPGHLHGRIHTPHGLPARAPLVVVLHGCLQSAAGYDHGSGWSDLADAHGFAVLFPEQQRANNPNLCFNWFQPEDTRRDEGEALSIVQMIDQVVRSHDLDRRRVFITGLSAGGAMTAAMLAIYPDVFAAGGIIAGLPYGVATTVPEAFDRMRGHGLPAQQVLGQLVRAASRHDGAWPAVSIWHGSDDRTVAPSNASAIAGQWRAVQGFGPAPTRIDHVAGHLRRTWCDADGVARIEDILVAGLGHGTPLDTGPEGCGVAGPYMLDAGISSTHHIARFFGLITAADQVQSTSKLAVGKAVATLEPMASDAADVQILTPLPKTASRPDRREPPRTPRPVAGVQKIIEDALRSAGLMK